jgi:CubicO group peptidase (beta-lactamase class C family)
MEIRYLELHPPVKTTSAVPFLVDEGKINWDDKVVKHIPEFKCITIMLLQNLIFDLLTHRSGSGLGAGGLMICQTDIILLQRYYQTFNI